MTAADHANTIRDALIEWGTHLNEYGTREKCLAALDALQTQAEAVGLELDVANQEHERAEAAEARYDRACKDIGRLQAERDRLAYALREIVADEQGWAEEIASAALAHKEQP